MVGLTLPFRGAEAADSMVLSRIAWTNRWRDRRESGRLANLAQRKSPDPDRLGDRKIAGLAHRTLAWQCRWNGRLDAAERQADRALELLRDTGNAAAMADVQAVRSATLCARGRIDEALQLLETVSSGLPDGAPMDTRIDLLCCQSNALYHRKRPDDAQRHLQLAIDLAIGGEKALVQAALARLHLDAGDLRDALAWGLSAVATCKVWRNVVVFPYALGILGATHLQYGRLDRARECLEEALLIARIDNDRWAECRIIEQIGPLLVKEGRGTEGIRLLKRALSVAGQLDHALSERRLCRAVARACEATGDMEGALWAYRKYAGLSDNDPG